jgi:hypothetical protein
MPEQGMERRCGSLAAHPIRPKGQTVGSPHVPSRITNGMGCVGKQRIINEKQLIAICRGHGSTPPRDDETAVPRIYVMTPKLSFMDKYTI